TIERCKIYGVLRAVQKPLEEQGLRALIHTVEASHRISLTLVNIGDDITFDCNVSEKELKFVNWYKQSLGHMVEICNLEQEVDSLVIILGGLLVCCAILIVLLIFYIKLKQKCGQGKGQNGGISLVEDDKSEVVHTRNLDGETIEANYASVQTRVRRSNEKKNLLEQCVYSSVKSDGHQNQLSSLLSLHHS
ncbi:hypothetical protein CCH79_00005756, partial [Gambusia affinis]